MAQNQRPLFFQFLLTRTIFSFSKPASLAYSICQQKQQKQQCYLNEKRQPTNSTITATLSNSSELSHLQHQLDSYVCRKDQNCLPITNSLSLVYPLCQQKQQKQQCDLNEKPQPNTILANSSVLSLPVTVRNYTHCARVGIGQPVKEFYFRLDTGSEINWHRGLPFGASYNLSDQIFFDPLQSSSYHPLPCDSQQCTSLLNRNQFKRCSKNNTCVYEVSYRDNSFSRGEFATETWSFGNSGSVHSVAFGCGHPDQGPRGVDGIIGLGDGVLGLPSQIKATSFSYCLVDINSTSSSTLDFNTIMPDDPVVVPVITNPAKAFYYVELIEIVIEGEQVSIPSSVFQIGNDGSGEIVVDTGNLVSQLETQVYNLVRDTFLKYSQNLPKTDGHHRLDTCFNLSVSSNFTVPTMSFQFSGGKKLRLKTTNYLLEVEYGKYCLAFVPTSGNFSIIGSISQTGMRVTYDLANKLIGFSLNKC